MTSLGSLARRCGVDLLLVIAACESVLELTLRTDPKAPRTTLWFTVPAIAVLVLVLLARRRRPFIAPAAFWIMAAAFSFVDGRLLVFPAGVFFAGLAAALLLGNVRDVMQARVGLLILIAAAGIIVNNDPAHSPGEYLFIPVLFVIGWLAGYAMHERVAQAEAAEQRAVQAEREREAAARVAVAEERSRIARELHDIVAHAVSVMVLQIGAVRHNLPSTLPAQKDALQGVEQAGRTALTEMRQLLGAMRYDGDDVDLAPQPGLDGLAALLEDVRRAGLPVRLQVEGEPMTLPRALDLSAYRIVQEGLTNALKHARASHADVTLSYRPADLQIVVRDDGAGATASDGLGHGLVGVRERVKIYGGEMTACADNGGGFVLQTRLPLGSHGA